MLFFCFFLRSERGDKMLNLLLLVFGDKGVDEDFGVEAGESQKAASLDDFFELLLPPSEGKYFRGDFTFSVGVDDGGVVVTGDG